MIIDLIFASGFAMAQAPKAEITTFRFADTRGRSAEACGKVTGELDAPIFVKVTVDEQSTGPGIYNVIVGPEKIFCVTVVTYKGTASASLWG